MGTCTLTAPRPMPTCPCSQLRPVGGEGRVGGQWGRAHFHHLIFPSSKLWTRLCSFCRSLHTPAES